MGPRHKAEDDTRGRCRIPALPSHRLRYSDRSIIEQSVSARRHLDTVTATLDPKAATVVSTERTTANKDVASEVPCSAKITP